MACIHCHKWGYSWVPRCVPWLACAVTSSVPDEPRERTVICAPVHCSAQARFQQAGSLHTRAHFQHQCTAVHRHTFTRHMLRPAPVHTRAPGGRILRLGSLLSLSAGRMFCVPHACPVNRRSVPLCIICIFIHRGGVGCGVCRDRGSTHGCTDAQITCACKAGARQRVLAACGCCPPWMLAACACA
eukprot:1143460-Pelagomonas_calceolata.AAC.7